MNYRNNTRVKINAQKQLTVSHYRGELQEAPVFIPYPDQSGPQGVSVITCTNRPAYMERVFSNYLQQNHELRELIVILNNNSMNLSQWRARAEQYENIRIFQLDEQTSLGECYNYAVDQSQYDYIAKFDDDDYYGPRYLVDAMAAFQYTNAGIVGKSCRFVYFEASSTLAVCEPTPENSFVDYVVGATMVIKKEVFQKIRFRNITVGEDSAFQRDCILQGIRIFSNNRYNYVTTRRPDKDTHTYQIADATYLSYCHSITQTSDYVPQVTT